MPGVKGQKKTGGRKKGTPNKATMVAIDFFRDRNFDPLEAMMTEYEASDDPKVRAQLLANLVKYRHPQLSTVALKNDDDGPLQIEIVQFAKSPITK